MYDLKVEKFLVNNLTPMALRTSEKAIKRTFFYKSESDPKVEYKTERFKDGKIFCTCKGFLYSRKCWHADKMATCA